MIVNETRIRPLPDADAAADHVNFEPVNRRPLWSVFDGEWYLASYLDAGRQMQAVGMTDAGRFYVEHGAGFGHSPNRYFDEAWYLAQNPDVAAFVAQGGFASGFAHYCHDGWRARAPHWLFSERLYRSRYPEITQGLLDRHGLVNGYDHYLALGDREFRSGHWFFDATLYRDNKPAEDRSELDAGGSFAQFLAGGAVAGSLARLSWYFDPAWYLRRYPEVADAIAGGEWRCALHHFLCNPAPQHYEALEWFSEAYYSATYPDVAAGVAAGRFRNGYEHFVRHGAAERRRPHPDIDLVHYHASGRVQAELEGGLYADAFAHWLSRLTSGALARPLEPIAEVQSKQLFGRAAEAMLPQLARRTLDFRVGETPALGVPVLSVPVLSVIIVLHNQFALTMMALASLRANFAGGIELILVDSGSTDETRQIERFVSGARVIRFAYNAGFVQCCNAGLLQASAPALLYLNNDLQLGLGAIEAALARLASAPDIGAVGAKLIRTNGALQEAGSIIWRDGTTFGYLRDGDPNAPEANFVRDVDYCSGAFLMLRTEIVRALGGFDDAYRPAYYEEADLCVRLRKRGLRVVYDPAVVVQHFEYGSADATASTRLMARNHRIFTAKHRDFLRYQHPPRARNAVHARSPKVTRPGAASSLRILFIEDRIPLRNLGAGYVRSNDIIGAMAGLGHLVSVFPIYKCTASPIAIYRDMPQNAEVLYERGMETLACFIEERAGYYDVVWIGRTHNLERLLPILGDSSAALPAHGFILDTEAIAAPRTAEQNRVLGRPQPESLQAAVARELACAYFCQKIVAVNDADAALIRQAGHSNVAILGHLREVQPTPSTWSQRRDLLFLGAIHDPGSPNHDSLEWFTTEVLPLLDARLAPEVRFTVAGFVRRGIDLSALGRHPRVDMIGATDDLAALYDRHRVFIAPTRFAGGIPFKVHEAASYGLPVAASELLRRQLGWTAGTEIQAACTDHPQAFADAVLNLYNSAETWNTIRRNALDRLTRENNQHQYIDTLQNILHDVCLGPAGSAA